MKLLPAGVPPKQKPRDTRDEPRTEPPPQEEAPPVVTRSPKRRRGK